VQLVRSDGDCHRRRSQHRRRIYVPRRRPSWALTYRSRPVTDSDVRDGHPHRSDGPSAAVSQCDSRPVLRLMVSDDCLGIAEHFQNKILRMMCVVLLFSRTLRHFGVVPLIFAISPSGAGTTTIPPMQRAIAVCVRMCAFPELYQPAIKKIPTASHSCLRLVGGHWGDCATVRSTSWS